MSAPGRLNKIRKSPKKRLTGLKSISEGNKTLELKFCPLFSGSSGNALYVGCGKMNLLVDAGLSGSRITAELQKIGVDGRDLDGILVTHEHADHCAGVGVLSRRYNLPVYATEGTWAGMAGRLGRIDEKNRRYFEAGEDFFLEGLNVTPFPIPHDANDPVGFSFCAGGVKLSVATDLGCIQEGWMSRLEGSDLVLLESNHDVEMLKAGPYPYDLKHRVLSRRGHLSNEDAGRALVELTRRGVRHALLGHLSGENNFPELAYETVALALREQGIAPGADVGLGLARRDGMSGLYVLSDGCAPVRMDANAARYTLEVAGR